VNILGPWPSRSRSRSGAGGGKRAKRLFRVAQRTRQYVEASYAGDLLADGAGAVGYLLKDRVGRVEEFLDALHRVANGGTVLDPQVVSQLLAGQRRRKPLEALTARERELLALMAEGHSNTEIARRLLLSGSAVEKHIGNVFAKLGLPPDDAQHRRVLAVLAFLRA